MKKDLENNFSKIVEETVSSLKDNIAELDRMRAKLDHSVGEKISNIENTEQYLERFYYNLDELEKNITQLPETVESHLERNMSKNMVKLSEHVFKEMRSASKTYSDELNTAASRYEKAVERLDTRLGWRAYAPPLGIGFLAFFMAFSLVWWLELGVTKLDTQHISRLENLGAAFYNCSPQDEKKVREIFKKSKQKREQRGR